MISFLPLRSPGRNQTFTYDPLNRVVSAQNAAQHFIWLFSYDYVNTPRGRPWPPGLHYQGVLIGFAVAFGIGTLALGIRRLQRWGAWGLCAIAIVFTYFLLDGYMRQVTPYWSQKGLIATYYRTRRSPDEKLLVWQMYWRGENFYTQNEIYEGPKDERTIFLGDKNFENLKAWMEKHRGRRAFFLVEHYADDVTPGGLAALATRLAGAAREHRGDVSLLGSACVPADEAYITLFRAPSADDVASLVTRAGVQPDRIVPVLWHGGDGR